MSDRYLLSPFFLDEPLPALERLAGDGWLWNRPVLPASTLQGRMTAVHRPLAERIAETLAAGERPVTVVGDCCAAIGVAAGLGRAGVDPVLVWLDAHGDFNTWDTTPSGFLGGMPLAMLTGRGDPTLMDSMGREPLDDARVVLTDARDLDPGEKTLLEESGVRHLADPRALVTESLPEGPVWVHFDVDVVDPADAPAVLYPSAGGLRAAELEEVFRAFGERREIAAVSLSTWSPEKDSDGRTRETCWGLLQTLLGRP